MIEKKSAKATASTIRGLTDGSQASTTARGKGLSTTATTRVTSGKTVTEHPLADDVHASKLNLVVIVVVLLAIFILLLVVAFGLMFFRRRRSHDKQCKCLSPCFHLFHI
ncbi:hypothetical protein pdam_00024348 [Pocillopora damicornis]|uniref:Uncharacterized protein n=1 Tax=Pocillopora damicornis TaxID=46731 RepID=A0A3M6UJY2_POCDA|nr:hypothetical protein pdam_00024348 [Pocillopora damicornis]